MHDDKQPGDKRESTLSGKDSVVRSLKGAEKIALQGGMKFYRKAKDLSGEVAAKGRRFAADRRFDSKINDLSTRIDEMRESLDDSVENLLQSLDTSNAARSSVEIPQVFTESSEGQGGSGGEQSRKGIFEPLDSSLDVGLGGVSLDGHGPRSDPEWSLAESIGLTKENVESMKDSTRQKLSSLQKTLKDGLSEAVDTAVKFNNEKNITGRMGDFFDRAAESVDSLAKKLEDETRKAKEHEECKKTACGEDNVVKETAPTENGCSAPAGNSAPDVPDFLEQITKDDGFFKKVENKVEDVFDNTTNIVKECHKELKECSEREDECREQDSCCPEDECSSKSNDDCSCDNGEKPVSDDDPQEKVAEESSAEAATEETLQEILSRSDLTTVEGVYDVLQELSNNLKVPGVCLVRGKSKSRIDAISKIASENGVFVVKISLGDKVFVNGETSLDRAKSNVRLFLNGFRNYLPGERSASLVVIDARSGLGEFARDLDELVRLAHNERMSVVVATEDEYDDEDVFEVRF